MIILLKTILITALIIFLFVKFWPPLGSVASPEKQKEYAEKTNLFYDGKFHTEEPAKLMDISAKSDFDKSAERIPKGTIPVNSLDKIPNADVNELKFIWFGHSTSLLQINGLNIFIDPVLSKYVSPVQGLGIKRMSELPIDAEKMPEIDVIVLSHDHYDHMDYNTIKEMDSKVKAYCVPLGVENHLIRWGIDEEKIHAMSWWDEVEINGLKITSTPGQHFSGRLPWGQNKSLWCGYVFDDKNHRVYYSGDTGYGKFFEDIHAKFGDMDLVIMEDGQYDNRWPHCHMTPEQSVNGAKILNAKWAIPVHFAGFCLSAHPWDDPVRRFAQEAEKENVKIATPMIGEIVDYDYIDKYKNKWWLSVK